MRHRSTPAVARVLAPLSLAVLVFAGCASPEPNEAQKASDLLTKALVAQSSGNPTLASHYYNNVLDFDPRNRIAYFNLGLIAQTQGSWSAAETNFLLTLSIDPGFPPARSSLVKLEAAHPEVRVTH
jgi:Tfp pilus assembly protein PilF